MDICQIVIFWEPDFSGELLRTTEDRWFVGDHWNDRISSIQVISGTWELYWDWHYEGEVMKLDAGSYPYVGNHWNHQISSFRCITRARSMVPQIRSVTPIGSSATQRIIITGSGFGTDAPYDGDGYFLQFYDLRGWSAGLLHKFENPHSGDWVHLSVISWKDSEIIVAGFDGAYTGPWIFQIGDQVTIQVWNPQTGAGPASYTSIVTAPSVSPVPNSAPPVEFTATNQNVECPRELPADADLTRCADQIKAHSLGVYWKKNGSLGSIPTPTLSAPLNGPSSSPVKIPFTVETHPGDNR